MSILETIKLRLVEYLVKVREYPALSSVPHAEMAKDNGENVNLFMRNFGSKLFDWFNERPDLQGQEELAINKVWADLKAEDPDRNYTEEGKKALRAYLKQWSIQNENFQRLYRKYDISVYDEDVQRESIADRQNGQSLQKVC